MRRPVLAMVAALVLLLVACDPTPAQPADLSKVTAAVDAVAANVQALSEQVDALAGRVDYLAAEVPNRVDALGEDLAAVAGGLDGLESDVEVLTRAALDLQETVTQPLDLANFNWGALTGVVVQTVPATAQVTIEPGECPDGTDDGYSTLWGNPVIGTTFHAAPAGTHCLRTLADEDFQESGVTVTIPDGVIVTVALLPLPQPAE